ncbi:MAG: secretin N-terminal domain-containing protein [Pseudomonadota bacterium]
MEGRERDIIEKAAGRFKTFLPLRRPGLIICLWLLVFSLTHADECSAEMAVIPLKFRRAAEMMPLVKSMLSPQGRAADDGQSNAIVINDDGDHIKEIRAILENFDRPVKQARVRLRFGRDGSVDSRSLSMEGQVSGKGWEISKGGGGRDGIQIGIQDRTKRREGQSEYFINVASGYWAYILVGKDIPYRERWVTFCRRYGNCPAGVVFQRIETGLEVRPIVLENHANIEILPRISHGGRGEDRGIVRFTQASTHLSAPLGKWVAIGGIEKESREVISAILDSSSAQNASSLSISVLVEAD